MRRAPSNRCRNVLARRLSLAASRWEREAKVREREDLARLEADALRRVMDATGASASEAAEVLRAFVRTLLEAFGDIVRTAERMYWDRRAVRDGEGGRHWLLEAGDVEGATK